VVSPHTTLSPRACAQVTGAEASELGAGLGQYRRYNFRRLIRWIRLLLCQILAVLLPQPSISPV
jgi:hypothetical protein